MGKFVDLTGNKFGRLTVLEKSREKHKNIKYICKCECGEITEVFGFCLKNGNTKSCGCLLSETAKKSWTVHSNTLKKNKTAEYTAWDSMIQRCTNPNSRNYKNYGFRGISVCERWMVFENFLEDMGEKPSKNHSIDRTEVNGNYEPGNCTWENRFVQAQNTRVKQKNNTGIKGCFWHEKRKKYVVDIGYYGKHKRLGYFETIQEAAEARKEAEFKYWGKSS